MNCNGKRRSGQRKGRLGSRKSVSTSPQGRVGVGGERTGLTPTLNPRQARPEPRPGWGRHLGEPSSSLSLGLGEPCRLPNAMQQVELGHTVQRWPPLPTPTTHSSHMWQVLSRVWPSAPPTTSLGAPEPLGFRPPPREPWVTSPSPLSVPQGASSACTSKPPGSCQIMSEIFCIACQASTAYSAPNVPHACTALLMLL